MQTAHTLNYNNMETLSQAEFQKRYGQDGISKFQTGDTISADQFQALSNQAQPPQTPQQPQVPLANKIANFFGAKGITEQFGADIARAKAPTQQQKNLVEYPTQKEVLGSAIQTGANLLPGAGKGLGLLGKAAIGAGSGYAFDVGAGLQDKNQTTAQALTPGIGTAVGVGLPVAGAVVRPATKIVSRLLKGLGSGLSGVSTETIDKIVSNPKVAQHATDKLLKTGNSKVLEENARTIVNGVSKVRQEARKAYGEGVQALKVEDINPQKFRQSLQPLMDKFGVSSQSGVKNSMKLSGVEFSDPKNIKTAKSLVQQLSKTPMDGFSLRKLLDKISKERYKTAVGDERLAFNAFIKELSGGVKDAISGSTDKLDEINKSFSSDMQLAGTVQNIFGKVNFKNLQEVVKASQKLETVFAQKGLAPDVVDRFLERIGVSAKDFKTTEAIRQITGKATGANTKGLSIGELVQQTTSAIITPTMVRDLSIKTGMAKETIVPFLRKMNPQARNVVIQALLSAQQDNSTQGLPQQQRQ